MSVLLGPDGRPIQADHARPRKPKLGTAYGGWLGREDEILLNAPGSSAIQFSPESLNLADYRMMSYHPQVNASLSVLMFMIHQITFEIQSPNAELRDVCEENMRDMWSRLIRAMSQAFIYGFSPIAIEYETDVSTKGYVGVSKFKDLYPEECDPKWKDVPGAKETPFGVPRKHKVFDGIRQIGWPTIPAENSLWYPFMMTNGNFYGKKMLKPAFMPWYFSILMHLYANRYFERFGEPLPIGRAPSDETIVIGGKEYSGLDGMEEILRNIRNRSVVSLPSDREINSNEYEWSIEYLTSEMRGADFEGYLSRLDEEISLAVFTPMLLFKTGNLGSNNLGVQHAQTFLWMLNAIIGDQADYYERYYLNRLRDINFPGSTDKVRFKWRELGKENVEMIRAVITELIRGDKVMPDLEELGNMAGLSLEEVKELTEPEDDDPDKPEDDPREVRDRPSDKPRGVNEPRATGKELAARIAGQAGTAYLNGRLEDVRFDPGFRKRMVASFKSEGLSHAAASSEVDKLYDRVEQTIAQVAELGSDNFSNVEDVKSTFTRAVERVVESSLESIQ